MTKRFLALLGALLVIVAGAAIAQSPTSIVPLSFPVTLATNQACSGGAQTYITGPDPTFHNGGQTQHYASAILGGTGTNVSFSMEIDGIDSAGHVIRISDVGMPLGGPSISNVSALVTASGQFAQIQVMVNCSPSTVTYTLTYSGTSATSNVNAGSYLFSQVDKLLFLSAPTGTGSGVASYQSPFGNSFGTILFGFNGGTPSTGDVLITCLGANGAQLPTQYDFPIAAVATQQGFVVPAAPCPEQQVRVANTTSGTTFNLEYIYSPPGFSSPPAQRYTHITGTTATAITPFSGLNGPNAAYLHLVTVNTGAAGTISIFDLPATSCTGTPATNVVAVITATTATLQTFTYDVNFNNGICVKASAAMDFTVSSQ